MLKSFMLASLLLASHIFGYNDGGGCNEEHVNKNINVCDSKDPSKVLKCVPRGMHFKLETTYGVWNLNSTCDYCCQPLGAQEPYCVSSETICEELENAEIKKKFGSSIKHAEYAMRKLFGSRRKDNVVPNKNEDNGTPRVITTMIPREKINESNNKVQ